MAVFKCKMCGGTLEINAGDSVAVCEYCNTKQTLPKLDDDKRAQLYDRANYFRRENEFDKAMGIYEMILGDDKEECESYWGIVLCRYGIEYVEDPRTHKRIPTVNRAQFTSIFEDGDYKNALKYADALQKEVYEAEATVIDKIQKGILAISQKEEPFDVFICYKETDSFGNRTQDSVYAQDIYNALTKEGYKVFFSRITLEDKLGSAYEPYIFAALNSAKVMLVVGTSKENFEAVWVKNEWSRFISLIQSGKEKTLIPVYKDISPYQMPEEFQYLQSQDMAKIGFMQDLVRGVQKIIGVDKPVKETIVVNQGNPQTAPLLVRASMFLEDGDFDRADEFYEQVLNLDPKNAQAYLGKLMAEIGISKIEELLTVTESLNDYPNFEKAKRFADGQLKTDLLQYEERVRDTLNGREYNKAIAIINNENSTIEDYKSAIEILNSISNFRDSKEIAVLWSEKVETIEKDEALQVAISLESSTLGVKKDNLLEAIELYKAISGWKDSDERLIKCQEELRKIEEAVECYKKQTEESARRWKRRKKKIRIGFFSFILALLVAFFGTVHVITVTIPKIKFRDIVAISAGDNHTLALKSDGTVVATHYIYNFVDGQGSGNYGQCEVGRWKDIVNIAAGYYHSVGVKSDGTVVAVGVNSTGQCNVSGWTDIVAVSAGHYHTVGLKSDGTVVAVGSNDNNQCNVSGWTDIIAIFTSGYETFGLTSDGTVVTTITDEEFVDEIKDWSNIVGFSAERVDPYCSFGDFSPSTIAVNSEGTVVTTCENDRENIVNWTDIVAVTAGCDGLYGLKSDGTVVSTFEYYREYIDEWSDIVAISASDRHIVGLKSDGTLVAFGGNDEGQCNVGG